MGRPMENLIGQEFTRWEVLRLDKIENGIVYWWCRCNCPKKTERSIPAGRLKNQGSKSCGCLIKETATKHGHHDLREYAIWNSMKQKCLNPKNKQFKDFGAKGITICNSWIDFSNFYQDIGNIEIGLNLVLKDGANVFNKDNIELITNKEHSNRKKSNKLITYDGRSLSIAEWSRITGISQGTLRARIFKEGWSIEKALNEPVKILRNINDYNKTLVPASEEEKDKILEKGLKMYEKTGDIEVLVDNEARNKYRELSKEWKMKNRYLTKEYLSRMIRRYANVISKSKQKGINNYLTFEEFCDLISIGKCHYCFQPLNPTGSGIDRKDSYQGYSIDNCVPCCARCNSAFGRNFTYEEKLVLAETIRKIDESREIPA